MTTEAKTRSGSGPLQPSTHEHGVWGTKSDAVGGFGESYEAQVAHGSDAPLGGDESEEEAPEDAPLGREVRKTLARAHVDAADLRVAVRGDRVTLLGSVRNSLEKAQIEARARAVPGVAQVVNRLNVLSEDEGSS
jgi:osmotically-inducible protein OsmY